MSELPLPSDAPWKRAWPADELERVPACPICGGVERTVLHEGLVDNVFRVAPGRWTLYSCVQCSSAYLDPRPSLASIEMAYGTYYTHVTGTSREDETQLDLFRLIRRMLSNDYVNARYGTARQPSNHLGRWFARLLPAQRQVLDVDFRFLPKPAEGQHLLDIGCGNGKFLVLAREAGWQVTGIEPDPKAAEAAGRQGVRVHQGTIDLLDGQAAVFDAVTLSHVIEHVHEPKQFMNAVSRLLKPGGLVYIDTPNILSHGARAFGPNWRGIETPRHLVLFNASSLMKLLSSTGFSDIELKRRTGVQNGMRWSSQCLLTGVSPYDPSAMRPSRLGWLRDALLPVKTQYLEFITLTARKAS